MASFKSISNKKRYLGSTNIIVSSIGAGTNRWAKGSNDENIYQVHKTSLDKGVNFFDTAEIYTGGKSEQLLGECIKRDRRTSIVASKYRPKASRRIKKDFTDALNDSLKRLGLESLDLYYVHFPPSTQSIEDLMDYMVEARDGKKIHSIGVSNFDAEQMRRASDRLKEHGLKLAANQVEYSLLDRSPERNGVLKACKSLNVSLVAYRPLARGKLTSAGINDGSLESNLVNVLLSIAGDHGGSVGQVALNWLIRRDMLVIPIPGATNVDHVVKNAGSLDWEMSKSEFNELEEAAS
jgi:aryl-alcohol dehydrogenase-like predicted oxidoreductase